MEDFSYIECPCGGLLLWDFFCGCRVCGTCGHHLGLARCYCGWSLSGGDGREELEEMGETIDEEDY